MAQRLGRVPSKESPGISEVTLAHLYRAEVGRSTEWRTRLDTTTNWAITTAAFVVSFTFSSATAPAAMLLAGLALVLTFLTVEARRYRYYDLFARRVRLLESGYLGSLRRREPVTADFYAAFSGELVRPRLRISLFDSIAFRLRRTYWPILALLLGAWWVKLHIHPTEALRFSDFVARASMGPFAGTAVIVAWFGCWLLLVIGLLHSHRVPLPATELRAPAKRRSAPLGAAFRSLGPHGRVTVPKTPEVRPASKEESGA